MLEHFARRRRFSLTLLFSIVLLAHTVETMTGFGATVIALALGAHLMALEELIVVLVLIGWAQSAWLVVVGWHDVRWSLLLGRIVPISVAGMALGAWCHAALPGGALEELLGGFVVAVAVLELMRLLRRSGHPRALPAPAGAALLAAGGFFHGLFACGGPLIVYHASRELAGKRTFRATLSALWLLLNSALVVSFVPSGRLAAAPATTALLLLPALAAGIALGGLLHERLHEGGFRISVQVILLLTGVSLLL